MIDDIAGHSRRNLFRIGAGALLAGALPRIAAAQGADKLKIGTVGAGKIASSIGGLLVKAGHPVLFSSRHPEELKSLIDGLGPLAKAGTVEEAIAFGDVIMLAVPYKAVPQIAKDYGAKLAGKIVLDADNPVAARDGEDLAKEMKEKGVGTMTASYFPGARIVRAFNSIGAGIFAKEAHRAGEPLAVPVAGDDKQAVEIISGLVRDAGFEPVVVPLARAQEFAPGGPLWGAQLTAKDLRARFGLTQ